MLRITALAALAGGLAVSFVQAQTVRKVLEFPTERTTSISIDDAGTAVYAVSSTNQFGTNAGYLKQIVRWDPASGIGTQITDFEEGVESVSVSDDGSWLAFVSRADPLGTNHDESPELYVMHPDGTGLAQLTSQSFSPVDLLKTSRGVVAAVISGSGNRIAFVGRIDPFGTNPSYTNALFVIDRTGSNLRLLRPDVRPGTTTLFNSSPTNADAPGFDISDDGTKIVFTSLSPVEFRGINADGTGQHSFSATTSPGVIAISGNGAKVVYTTSSLTLRVRSFDGNPATIVSLGSGERASIKDDATQVIFYRAATPPSNPAGIWRIASTGGAATLLAQDLRIVSVSGDGSRIVARGTELVAIDGAGANLQQLTMTTVNEFARLFTMSSDGSTAHFSSSIDPPGTAPDFFSYGLDSGQFWQRTAPSASVTIWDEVLSDDGSVFFISSGDPVGQNACGDMQVFRLSLGGAYTQLTACGEGEPYFGEGYFAVRRDGQVAVFIAPVFWYELFAVNGDGTARTQLTPGDTPFSFSLGALGVAGTGPVTWVAFTTLTTTEDAGGVFRVKADGTALQRLTTWGDDTFPSISADGSVVAWYSTADYGGNPDHSFEDFVFDDATQSFRQITNDEQVFGPIVTQDGQWVFGGSQRFHVASGASEYIRGGLPDATGTRWLIPEYAGFTQGKTTLFLADVNAVPSFVVDKASPTVLSWDPSPFSLRYDVVRGSIANLSIAGSTVNLGPVSCLEDDSPDEHTRGHADPVSPAPGQAFFYLYRGSVGFNAATGSYGQGSGARERVAGAGGCNP